jgi:hypothetical protein
MGPGRNRGAGGVRFCGSHVSSGGLPIIACLGSLRVFFSVLGRNFNVLLQILNDYRIIPFEGSSGTSGLRKR